ncbi:chromate efflux transporter [Ovoidimarina sediminis]|uniref:chromate efflux transporter n=1 Tax=Ovoidimarina sediminis TaxID=3079856 RepID=UPI0029106942|nr:chromate efflux transporter [Rhodophyticola sp. MJ-SS7]MDU8944368.1 chromate efflux transporter [Rhodophyticola sp. MJ-SS7]
MPAASSDLVRVFGRIGLLSFGGPAAQIALMHRELVEERGWLDEQTYLRALSFAMLLPGPEAMQLATYAGWKRAGLSGGLIAGGLFVLPGALVVLALAMAYGALGTLPLVQAVFLGVKAAVIAIVLEALLKVSKRALRGPGDWIVAALSFVAIFALALPFPLIILLAGLWGAARGSGTATAETPLPDIRGTGRTVALWLTLWLTPILLLWASGAAFLTQIALFFSKLAVVTFGGAYAVLAYMTQEVVQDRGWLTTHEMIDGLGLAETTPGPLILVTEFVGYTAGTGQGGMALGLAAAALTLWVTFIPCFLWIFAGAPYLDWIAGRPRLTGALSGITAAVVGVILNLSIWFAAHVVFGQVETATLGALTLIAPVAESLNPVALALSAAASVALLVFRWPLLGVLGLSALLGLLAGLLT